jgi:hypothetical protein
MLLYEIILSYCFPNYILHDSEWTRCYIICRGGANGGAARAQGPLPGGEKYRASTSEEKYCVRSCTVD